MQKGKTGQSRLSRTFKYVDILNWDLIRESILTEQGHAGSLNGLSLYWMWTLIKPGSFLNVFNAAIFQDQLCPLASACADRLSLHALPVPMPKSTCISKGCLKCGHTPFISNNIVEMTFLSLFSLLFLNFVPDNVEKTCKAFDYVWN